MMVVMVLQPRRQSRSVPAHGSLRILSRLSVSLFLLSANGWFPIALSRLAALHDTGAAHKLKETRGIG